MKTENPGYAAAQLRLAVAIGRAANRGPGRPPVGETSAVGQIHIRTTMSRKNSYVRAAQMKRQGLSEWITQTCDKEAWTEINKPS